MEENLKKILDTFEEEDGMTEAEVIHEISVLVKEINQHRVAIRDLENEIYKLEDLLRIN
jgi:hypothetical protein